MSRAPERARALLERAAEEAERPDGRASLALARLALQRRELTIADALAHRAIERASDWTEQPNPARTRARGWALVAEARRRLDRPAEAMVAYLASLGTHPEREVALRARRLSRRAERRDPDAVPIDIHGVLAREEGTRPGWGPCDDPEPMHEDEHRCRELDRWERGGIEWRWVAAGHYVDGAIDLWARRGEEPWVRFGGIGSYVHNGATHEHTRNELRFVGTHQWAGRRFDLFHESGSLVDYDGCEAWRTDRFRDLACTLDGEGGPECLVVDRGRVAVSGPGLAQLEDPARARVYCGSLRQLEEADQRPQPVERAVLEPRFELDFGPRGIRARGWAAPPALVRWRGIDPLLRWARAAGAERDAFREIQRRAGVPLAPETPQGTSAGMGDETGSAGRSG